MVIFSHNMIKNKSSLNKKIDICIFSTTCRSGLNFLTSCLDSHSEVIIIPSLRFFSKLYDFTKVKDLKNFKTNNEKKFILNFSTYLYKAGKDNPECKFLNNSKDKKKFTNILMEEFKKRNDTKFLKKLFFSIHIAFAKFYKMNLRKKKIIIVSEKSTIFIPFYENLFDNIKILLLVRNPINSFAGYKNSYIKNHSSFPPTSFNYFFAQMKSSLRYINKKKIIIIKNENMNRNLILEMKKISNKLNIKFSKTLLKTTIMNKKYGSDSSYLIKRNENYRSKLAPKNFHNFKNQFERSLKIMNDQEILMIQSSFYQIFKRFNYNYILNNNLFNFIKGYFFLITFYKYNYIKKYNKLILFKNFIKRMILILSNKNRIYFWLNLT